MKLINDKKFLKELKTYGIYHHAYEHLKEILSKHLRDLPKKKNPDPLQENYMVYRDGYNQCQKDCGAK